MRIYDIYVQMHLYSIVRYNGSLLEFDQLIDKVYIQIECLDIFIKMKSLTKNI